MEVREGREGKKVGSGGRRKRVREPEGGKGGGSKEGREMDG